MAAIKAKDEDALDKLIDKTKPKKIGEESGATLYQDGDTVFAVEDDTVVFAGNRQQLTQALARADGDDHLDEDTFNEGLEGLPDSALARVYADLEALLEERSGLSGRTQDQVGRRAAHAGRDRGGEGRGSSTSTSACARRATSATRTCRSRRATTRPT